MRRLLRPVGIALLALLAITATAAGAAPRAFIHETEPNNTPATANQMVHGDPMQASLTTGDVDYYAVQGINATWGYIAMAYPQQGTVAFTLRALRNDGVTILEEYTGDRAVIALRNFVDRRTAHYLSVAEAGLGGDYAVEYYETVVASWPEVEPNDTPATGTPFSFTNAGIISSPSDTDCFTFHGRAGDRILFALDTDPEGDGNPCEGWGYSGDLYGPTGEHLPFSLLADYPDGAAWTEPLTQTGIYALCVASNPMCGGPDATYKVGLLRNARTYFPEYRIDATWLDPPPDGTARVGDILTFNLSVTNTSPITIPGAFDWTTEFDASCLELVSTNPPATQVTSGSLSWAGQKSVLAPGEAYSVTFTARALKPCIGRVNPTLYVAYYFTGTGKHVDYRIWGDEMVHLPLVRMAAP